MASESTHAVPRNDEVAGRLEEMADLFDAQSANPDRIRVYRTAAQSVRRLKRPIADILAAGGPMALTELEGVGVSLARHIEHLVESGRLALLERLRGDARPEDVYTSVPGIGPKLAARIHHDLHIESLHDLELAAWDGRLATVEGFGQARQRTVREALAGRFRRPPRAGHTPLPSDAHTYPSVEELLDVDREYRRKAKADRLPRIAPHHFNPTGEAWLPILHTQRGDRHYTALFSNTAHAHEMRMTRDWVIIYRDDHDGRGQWTVITAHFGRMEGKRLVRGRETECRDHYFGL